MRNIIKSIGILLASFGSQTIQSQIYFGVNASPYSFLSENISSRANKQSQFAFKVGYVYDFSKKFGIGSGIELSQSKQNIQTFGILQNNVFLIDDTNSAFEYRVKAEGYSEKQLLTSLQIPLFIQYKSEINTNTFFYTRLGAKYMLPLKYETKGSASSVMGEGFYPDFNLLISNLSERGFGSQNNYEGIAEYETENIFLGSLEFGFSFKVAKKGALYAGFYLDHALQSLVQNNQEKTIVGYAPNSVLNRTLNGLAVTQKNAEIKPVNFGITLSYSIE